MHTIKMPESEMRKVVRGADVNELLNAVSTMQRLQVKKSETRARLDELDALLASSTKRAEADSPWRTALQDHDQYGAMDARKELIEEHTHLSESLSFTENAIEDGRCPLDSVMNRVSAQLCAVERRNFTKDIQAAISACEQVLVAFRKLDDRRGELESKGISTGSLPPAVSRELVSWVDAYFDQVRRGWPEVKVSEKA